MKATASPYSTGGGGTVLEHRYGAVLLTHVLTGAPLYELGDTAAPLALKFQAGAAADVDDFLVTGVLADESEVCASIGVRRNPLMQRKNDDSKKLVGAFLKTLDHNFDAVLAGTWKLVLASVVGSNHAQEVAELVSLAHDASADNKSFRALIDTPKRTTSAIRGRLKQLDGMVEDLHRVLGLKNVPEDPKELTWLLLSCLRVRLLHLEGGDQSDRTSAIERLIPLTAQATAAEAEAVFSRLAELCGSFAPAAINATENHVRQELGQLLPKDVWADGVRRRVAREPSIQRHRRLIVPTLSAQRRQARLALGLSLGEVEKSFANEPELPKDLKELQPGNLLVLVGPIGSGKSDLAARWLMQEVEAASNIYGAPIPYWIRAEELSGPLESYLEKSLGTPEAPERFGVDVVVDGLDETADNFGLLDIQTFVAKYPKCRVVLTTRPGQNLGKSLPEYEVPAWTPEEAGKLMESVLGENSRNFLWTDELNQSVRRPLFALLAAQHSKTARGNSPAELIVAAVNAALGGHASDTRLEELAVCLTRAGRAIDPRQIQNLDLISLRSTRLVEFVGPRVRFSLPIFQQWFAAQAVLSGRVSAAEFIADVRSFGRWRYVLAVAVASGTHETMTPVLEQVAAWNPGAAAWVLGEGKNAALDVGELPLLSEPILLGEEIRRAMKAWLQGLGPIGQALYPAAIVGGSGSATLEDVQLSISWNGQGGHIMWTPKPHPDAPNVVDANGNWNRHSNGSVIAHAIGEVIPETWVWDYTLKLLTTNDRIASALQSRELLLAATKSAGIAHKEDFAWSVLVALEESEFYPFPLTEEVLERAIERAQSEAKQNSQDWVERNGLRIRMAFYEQLVQKVRDEGDRVLNDIWPGPDLAPGEGTFGYSEEQIFKRARAVHEAAAEVYEELRISLLPGFDRMLGHAATFPAVMEGYIRHDRTAMGGDFGITSLDYWFRVVREPNRNDAPPLVFNLVPSKVDSKRWDEDRLSEVWATLDRRRNQDPTGSVFEIATYAGTTLDPSFFGRRPATHVAIQWLLQDLQGLRWVTSISPTIRIR